MIHQKGRFTRYLKIIGPGIAVAATGVGAGDMIAAAVSGARYGYAILWSALFGALIKYALNEGIARWQLATGTTMIEGWSQQLGRAVSLVFAAYLIIWGFIVAGALMAACGLGAHALFGGLSVAWWAMLHSIAALLMVLYGRYQLFEKIMKLFIGMMFLILVTCMFLVVPDFGALGAHILMPALPAGSAKFVLGVVGGVGGTVTLLNYGYWIREKGWVEARQHANAKIDVAVAYILTGVFGLAVMVIAAGVNPENMTGSKMVLEVANRLGDILGPIAKWPFLLGFWGAVFSSMLGVWQGVPYIFADFMRCWRGETAAKDAVNTDSAAYRGFLFYLAIPPMVLLLAAKPVWIVVIYSISGALFMPFLAGTLLYMNNQKRLVGDLQNSWRVNLLLVSALAVFGWLAINTILQEFSI